jgi:acetylornithine/N-succinyldiaminopimelate aminotransferase
VQAGIGRTGTWFSWQSLGFTPDIATTAKALANGLPVGACVARGAAAEAFKPGQHGSTFGGNPLVSRTACMVLDIMREEGLAERAGRIGGGMLEAFRQRLAANANVREVRGRGLMLGIELKRDANQLKQAALDRGLFLNVTQDRVIRLLPPLIIDDEQAAEIVDTVCRLVEDMDG